MNKAALILVAALGAPTVQSCALDEFPRPASMEVMQILPITLHNGYFMQAWAFETPQPVEQIAEYYQQRLTPLDRTTFNGLWQLSHLKGSCFFTVQLPAADDRNALTYGRLTLTYPPITGFDASAGPPEFWVPQPGQVVADTQMTDPGKTGRVTLISAANSGEQLAEYYQSQFARRDWSMEQHYQDGDAHSMTFQNDADVLTVQLVPAPGMTQVLIVLEQRP
ncbi:hypothetical protein [Litorivicinus lipolyticus]|uniref:hypothetical protein n=1 Tax=Litorivicinus lipolyticus TaxID=418701 RepID=UPI003B5A065D